MYRLVTDWEDAYANAPHIPSGDSWPDRWATEALTYREAMAGEGRARLDIPYGEGPRNRLDLFLPAGRPEGLVVFVHGGYWRRFDRSTWSHLAAGAVESGHAVAIPSYTLCPSIRIGGITREVAAAIEAAAGLVDGPVRLAGHSAGGQLVARMISSTTPLGRPVLERIVNVVPISGVHDLRPLMRLTLNEELRLDEAECLAESPALLRPLEGVRITSWVGAAERSEFVRQSALLANVWIGLGAATAFVEEPDRHHFNVVDGLRDARHPLLQALLS